MLDITAKHDLVMRTATGGPDQQIARRVDRHRPFIPLTAGGPHDRPGQCDARW